MQKGLPPGESLQKILRFDLKEEGNHVLAISVSYTENTMAPQEGSGGGRASSGRARTFRKLYQFMAQPCISVRTKATELLPFEIDDRSHGPYGKARLLRYVLEAQLENVGDGAITLQVGGNTVWIMGTANYVVGHHTQRQTTFQSDIVESATRFPPDQSSRYTTGSIPSRAAARGKGRIGDASKRCEKRWKSRTRTAVHRVAQQHGRQGTLDHRHVDVQTALRATVEYQQPRNSCCRQAGGSLAHSGPN